MAIQPQRPSQILPSNVIEACQLFKEYSARVCGKSVKIWQNPIMTFPIKKRINTELFIDEKHELYKHKRRIKKSLLGLLEL